MRACARDRVGVRVRAGMRACVRACARVGVCAALPAERHHSGGFRAWGLGFRVWGSGLGAWGLGFEIGTAADLVLRVEG